MEGKVQEACADFEKALVVDPSNSQAKELFNLAVQQFSIFSLLCETNTPKGINTASNGRPIGFADRLQGGYSDSDRAIRSRNRRDATTARSPIARFCLCLPVRFCLCLSVRFCLCPFARFFHSDQLVRFCLYSLVRFYLGLYPSLCLCLCFLSHFCLCLFLFLCRFDPLNPCGAIDAKSDRGTALGLSTESIDGLSDSSTDGLLAIHNQSLR